MQNFWNWFLGRQSTSSKQELGVAQTPASIESIYTSMIAGRFKLVDGSNHKKTAYWLAREALDTEAISQICGKDEEYAYYIATPAHSSKLTGRLETGLAAAIPGNPGYKGIGVYVLRFTEQNFAVAIFNLEDDFKILANETAPIFEAVEESGLPVIDCSETLCEPLISLNLAAQESAYRLNKVLSLSAGLVLFFSFILFLSLKVAAGFTGSILVTQINERERQLEAITRGLNLTSPLASDIARLTDVASTAARAGGWIKLYTVNEKGEETFEIHMPSWISRDYIEALGPSAKVDPDRVKDLLIVTKAPKPAPPNKSTPAK